MKRLSKVVLALLALAVVLSCSVSVKAGTANEKKRTSPIGWETIGWCLTADKIDVTKDSLPAASKKDIMTTTSKMDNSSATDYKLQYSGGVTIKDEDKEYEVGYYKKGESSNGRVITDHSLIVTDTSKKKEVIAGLLSGYFNDVSSHKEANAVVFDVEKAGAQLTEKDFNQLVNGTINWKTETSGKYKGKKVAYVWAQTIIATYKDNGDTYNKDSEGYIKQYRSLSAWKNAYAWASPSTFANHYNIPIKLVKGSSTVTIQWVSRSDCKVNGTTYKAGQLINTVVSDNETNRAISDKSKKKKAFITFENKYNYGDTVALKDLRLTKAVKFNKYTWAVCGIRVKSTGGGTNGITLLKNPATNKKAKWVEKSKTLNRTVYASGKNIPVGKDYCSLPGEKKVSAKSKFVLKYATDGSKCSVSSNSLYGTYDNAKITIGDETVITYYVDPLQVGDDYEVKGINRFWYLGNCYEDSNCGYLEETVANSKNLVNLADANAEAVKNVFEKFEYMPYSGAHNVYDLRSGGIPTAGVTWWNSGTTLTDSAGNGVINAQWGSSVLGANFFLTGTANFETAKNNFNDKATKLQFAAKAKGSETYNLTANYQAVSPQVCLKYYRDGDGNLSLFYIGNVTSNGGSSSVANSLGSFSTNSALNANYAGTSVSVHANGYLASQKTSLEGNDYTDMVLVQSQVVDFTDPTKGIKGWTNASVENGFTESGIISGTTYGGSSNDGYDGVCGEGNGKVTGLCNFGDNLNDAMDAAGGTKAIAGNSNVCTLTAMTNYCPTAFVFIYTQTPKLFVKTYVTTDTKHGEARTYRLFTEGWEGETPITSTDGNGSADKMPHEAAQWAKRIIMTKNKGIKVSSLLGADSHIPREDGRGDAAVKFETYGAEETVNGVKVSLRRAILRQSNSYAELEPLIKLGQEIKGNELDKYVSYLESESLDPNAVIDMKGYQCLIKIVEPEPISYWEVNYFDAEDGERDVTHPYANYKYSYARLEDPKNKIAYTIGEAYGYDDSKIEKGVDKNYLSADLDGYKLVATTDVSGTNATTKLLGGEYDLVNVGVSTKTMSAEEVGKAVHYGQINSAVLKNGNLSYVNGFVKDLGAESNTYAGKYYARTIVENLEKSDSIFWMWNPYTESNLDVITPEEMQIFFGKTIPDGYDKAIADGDLKNQSKSSAVFNLVKSAEYEGGKTGSSVWVWAIYKSKKEINSAILLENEDGTCTAAVGTDYNYTGGWKNQELNVYTTEYTLYYPEYMDIDGKTYKREDVYNKWGNDGSIGYSPNEITNVATVMEWGSITKDETMDKVNDNLTKEKTLGGSEKFSKEYTGDLAKKDPLGGEYTDKFSTNAFTTRVKGQYNYVVAVYKPYEPECPEWEYTTEEELIQDHDTVGGVASNNSRTALDAEIWERGYSKVVTDEDLSSADGLGKHYEAETAIPTSEYLRTGSVVPKYLADVDMRKTTRTAHLYMLFYEVSSATYTYKDTYGNEVMVNASRLDTYLTENTKSITYYSLEGSTIFIPSDATVDNYGITQKIGDVEINHAVTETLQKITQLFAEESGPHIDVEKSAVISLPVLSHEGIDTSIHVDWLSYEVGKYAEGKTEAAERKQFVQYRFTNLVNNSKKVSDDLLPNMMAKNDVVTFYDGDGGKVALLADEPMSVHPSEPLEIPQAADCDEGIFDSKYGKHPNYADWQIPETAWNTQWLRHAVDVNGKYTYNPITYVLGDYRLDNGSVQPVTNELQIEKWKKNGAELSRSAVHYVLWDKDNLGTMFNKDGTLNTHWGSEASDEEKEVTESAWDTGISFGLMTNNITILTPAYVSWQLESQEKWNQEIQKKLGQTLVLDKPFHISLTTTTDSFSENPGYGKRDYSQYLMVDKNNEVYQEVYAEKDENGNLKKYAMPVIQIKFPFEVVHCLQEDTAQGKWHNYHIPANTWYEVAVGDLYFLLPSWVKEGSAQVIKVRAITQNAYQNDWLECNRKGVGEGEGKSESMKYGYKAERYDRTEMTANRNSDALNKVSQLLSNVGKASFDTVDDANDKLDALISPTDEEASVLDAAEPDEDEGATPSEMEEANKASQDLKVYTNVVKSRDCKQSGEGSLDEIPWMYVATDNQVVNVVGRLYGFEIIDIGDYPAWKDFFRNSDNTLGKNSYTAGIADKNSFANGVSFDRIIPTMDGKNDKTKGVGYMKAGYPVRFKVETVGNLSSSDDYVEVCPYFTWLDANGNQMEQNGTVADGEIECFMNEN